VSGPAGSSAGIGEYLKRAFLYPWNLLIFLGASAGAALSPWPDALLPLVGAMEIAYLGGLISVKRFRDAIDAQVYKESQKTSQAASSQTLTTMLQALAAEHRNRFEALRRRCLEMRAIIRGVSQTNSPAESLSTPALDKLLWVFLRLLVSEQALERFLASASEAEIQAGLEQVQQRLKTAPADPRFQRSLEDSVQAHEQRLANYRKAKENGEFVRLELDRIEVKIRALAESGVGSQDPDSLTSQIRGVTESVQSTESAMKELQQITGIIDQMQEPPAIMEARIYDDRGQIIQGGAR
jgi:hypothetical protein